MLPHTALALLALTVGASAASVELPKRADYSAICAQIEKAVSKDTKVYYPGSAQYDNGIAHWNPSSAQPSACTVEPVDAKNVGVVVKIVGSSKTPFTVKSGGHATNPNFSSTPGVLIVMNHFTGTVYDAKTETATFGVGQIWEDVYSALQPFNRSVAGGRAPGIGVGGFTAGGGYAWQTSESGLGIDHVVRYEVVTPEGKVINVTEASNNELFWALKGTGNNFGVVTRVTMKALKQGAVWGGQFTVGPEQADAMMAAFSNWDTKVTDPKAAINIVITRGVGTPGVTSYVQLFYNGDKAPAGIFDEFLALPAVVSDLRTRTLVDLVSTLSFPPLVRSAFENVPTNKFPLELVHAFSNETQNVIDQLKDSSLTMVIAIIEGFQRDYQTHAKNVTGFNTPSAWPATRSFAVFPNGFWALYNDTSDDEAVLGAVLDAGDRLRATGAQFGVTDTAPGAKDAVKYPNYAVWANPPEAIYGSALPKLRELQTKFDPNGVMKLAGGFKLQ